MPGKTSSQISNVTYCYDECLPPIIGNVLKEVGFPIVLAPQGTQDEDLIPEMGRLNQVWITKDNRSKTEHENLLATAQISVVWVRGLTHEGRRKAVSMQRHANLKDILRMLVNKLDDITIEIEKSRGPRYFLLFTTTKARKDRVESYPTLRKVRERLAGKSRR